VLSAESEGGGEKPNWKEVDIGFLLTNKRKNGKTLLIRNEHSLMRKSF
jgi:hypothetical protein